MRRKRGINPKTFLPNSEPTNYQVLPGLEPGPPLASSREIRLQ